jgi:hypothetical protein
MLTRPKLPKPKNVLIINDIPFKTEVENEEPFCSASNLGMFTSFRTGRVFVHNSTPVINYKGISLKDIHYTYLDYLIYGEGEIEENYDFCKEIKRGKELQKIQILDETFYVEKNVEGVTAETINKFAFYPLATHKDIYVSHRLFLQFSALLEEIKKVNPKLIIVTGKWSLFFLTGMSSFAETMGSVKDRKPLGALVKFRSSIMKINPVYTGIEEHILIPMWHPLNAISMPDKAPIMELDIQRIAYVYNTILEKGVSYYLVPPKKVYLGTSFFLVRRYCFYLLSQLDRGPIFLSVDIETLFKSVIDCIGITTSKDFGFCVPFATVDNPNLWTPEEEVKIWSWIKEILEHPNAKHIGQNYSYDCQYFYKLYGISVKPTHDTMVLHHILYNYLPKDLAFLASLYCEFYSYWKDDITATKETPEQRWTYNCKDIMYTLEVLEILLDILNNDPDKRLKELYEFQINDLEPELITTMNFGVKVDKEQKEELFVFFSDLLEKIRIKINDILGFEFNSNSTPQKKKLFKEFFGMELKMKKNKGRASTETCDAAAMKEYVEEYPMLQPFLTLLLEQAAIKVFTRTFLGMLLDEDDRARTQYKSAKTKTGRLASVKNVWGKGGNFQNLTTSGKLPLHYALEVLNGINTNDIEANEAWEEFIEGVIETMEGEYEDAV